MGTLLRKSMLPGGGGGYHVGGGDGGDHDDGGPPIYLEQEGKEELQVSHPTCGSSRREK